MSDTPSRRNESSSAGRRRRPKRTPCAQRDRRARWRRRRTAARSTASDVDGADEVLRSRARKDGGLRGRHPHGAAGDSREPALPVPPRGDAGRRARRADLSHQRPRPRVAAVVLPLGHGAGRGAAEGRAARHAARRRRCSSSRCGACSPIRASEALSTRFAAQWLRLQDLDKIDPDALLFPYFDDDARRRDACAKPSCSSTASSARIAASLDLLTADYTFVNERLARHYGIPNVTGSEFRRCTLADDTRRGLLGQGSILMLTSVADRTSPVLRGKWVMEVLLGIAAAAAAAERAALDETKATRRTAGCCRSRERMEEHREEPGVQLVPPRDRSARPGARELRRHRRLAHQGQRRAGRRGRRALRRHEDRRARRACARAAEAPGRRSSAASPRT